MALKEMTTVLDCERESLELENMHEYAPEFPVPDKSFPSPAPMYVEKERIVTPQPVFESQPPAPKSDELETLWPGVHHELAPQARRSASFYLTIGFMAGAFISLGGVFGYSVVSQKLAQSQSGGKTIVISAVPAKAGNPQQPGSAQPARAGEEILLPAAPSYEVKTGDTLAAIALRNYKHVSPRLLDEICKANNLRNANVLNLGQKLLLPEYHSQASAQVAGLSTQQNL